MNFARPRADPTRNAPNDECIELLLREILSGQRELASQVQALREAVERIRRKGTPPREIDASVLLRTIVAAVGHDFTVAELFEYAEVEAPLCAAIVASVGALNPHKLGGLLAKIERNGGVHDGLTVHRIGTTSHAGRWAIVERGV